MTRVYRFDSVNAIITEEKTHSITLYADNAILSKMQKELTIEDKNTTYQIKQLLGKIKRLKKAVNLSEDKLYEKTMELKKELEELKKKQYIEFFYIIDDNHLEVPKGFWWYANNSKLETELKFVDFPKGKKDINPRSYQKEAVEHLIKHKRAMVELATGLGKTVVLTHLVNVIKENHDENFRTMIVVPNVELMEQTLSFIQNFFPDATGLGGKKKYKTSNIMVGVVNSCIQYADRFDAIIIDEVHHSSSSMYNQLVWMSKAKYIWGMTATPTRADGMIMGVHANCGPVVYRRDTQWGVQNGYLSPSVFWQLKIQPVKKYSDNISDPKAYKMLLKNPLLKREIFKIIKSCMSANKTILFLTKHVEPSKEFADFLSQYLGIKVEAAHAKYKKPLKDFKDGKIKLLIANDDLCGEGVDIPGVDCMVNLTQRSSESKVRQILGRGLRVAEGKNALWFFDIVLLGYGTFQDKGFFDRYEFSGNKRANIYREINNVKIVEVRR